MTKAVPGSRRSAPLSNQHDFSVAYLERDLGHMTSGFTQQISSDGRTVLVQGKCPVLQRHFKLILSV